MDHFDGECVGGPWDGKRMAHWSKSMKLYGHQPVKPFDSDDRAPVEAVEVGEYRLNDSGQWHWRPTASGIAYDNLFGAPRP